MIRTKINMDQERSIITNLITDKEFAQKVLPILQPKYFKTRYAKVVSAWVRDYFDRYEDVPGALIQDIFLQKQSSLVDEEEMESVATFLQSLSDEQDKGNSDYSVDIAIKYLKLRSLEIHKDQLEEAIALHDPVKGEQSIANFHRVGLPEGDGADILCDASKISAAFNTTSEYVFTFPGALAKTIGDPMKGDMMAFLGKPKGFKSHALWFTAETAMQQGCNVLYFTLEMREPQMIRRAWQSMTSTPKKDGVYKVPYFAPGWVEGDPTITENSKHWSIEYETLNKKAASETPIQDNLDSFRLAYGGGNCKFIFLPMYSATVEDLVAYLDNLYYYEGYVPDVMIVDYADILRPSKESGRDYRDQINNIWMKLRGLAQSRNMLVVTASQTNRAGMNGDIQLDNTAEDMRKIAHVSLLIALDQNKKEKEAGVIRMDTLAGRDDAVFDQAVILQNLNIGRFYIDSQLGKQVDGMDEFKEDKK
jgi:hypothetical protein